MLVNRRIVHMKIEFELPDSYSNDPFLILYIKTFLTNFDILLSVLDMLVSLFVN